MAPEVADSLPYNHKADVYSFGMFAHESALHVGFTGWYLIVPLLHCFCKL
jgi:hypothetical protein